MTTRLHSFVLAWFLCGAQAAMPGAGVVVLQPLSASGSDDRHETLADGENPTPGTSDQPHGREERRGASLAPVVGVLEPVQRISVVSFVRTFTPHPFAPTTPSVQLTGSNRALLLGDAAESLDWVSRIARAALPVRCHAPPRAR